MLRNPAGERNKQPILDAIKEQISEDAKGNFLEISSGNFQLMICKNIKF